MIEHGSFSSYNGGCRCDECRGANASHKRDWRTKKNAETGKPPSIKRISNKHGTSRMYHAGRCRCSECVQANSDYVRKHKNSDKNALLTANLRSRLSHSVRRASKGGSSVRDLGCSMDEFRTHLEKQFVDGMSWDNYGCKPGCWNIDHIIPLNTFDLSDREQFLKACHYTNMRPLWHIDNIKRPYSGSDVA